MEEEKRKAIQQCIEKAKKKLNDIYRDDRDWKSVKLKCDGYPECEYDLELITRPGSPCKGYIVVNYGTWVVRAFDNWDAPRGIFRAKERFSCIV